MSRFGIFDTAASGTGAPISTAAGAIQTSDTVREVTRMTGDLQQLVAQFKV